jgi:AraC family transcriptional activator of tynA and feaB
MGQLKVWSTEGLASDKALSFWNEAVCSAFLDVRTERGKTDFGFHAHLQSRDVGPLLVNRLQAQPYSVSGGNGGGEWAFINLHHTGRSRLRQHGREHLIAPGDVSLNLGCTPFDFQFADEVAMTCLRLPLARLASRTLHLHDAVARPLQSSGTTQLFMGYAQNLLSTIDGLQSWQTEQAVGCLMDLLALAIGSNEAMGDNTRASMREALYQRAQRYLIQHHGDAGLAPANLAAYLHLAPRTLQGLFQEHGTTFTERLLDIRLLAAEQLVSQARGMQMAQIAYRVGFSDLSYFNRAFRRRFGMTPGERRRSD